MSHSHDAIIIGTGQAGPPLARRLSSAGMSVAIVERHLFGGTCVNTGCIPMRFNDGWISGVEIVVVPRSQMNCADPLERNGAIPVELEFVEPLLARRERLRPQQQHRFG